MAIEHAIKRAFDKKAERGWDKWPKMYIMVDLHDVIIPGTYTLNNEGRSFCFMAKEVLQKMTKNDKICLILWTSSYPDAITDISLWLSKFNIKFDYIGGNPECLSTDILDVEHKPYFDLLFDDKAGFEGDSDWEVVGQCFDRYFLK